MKHRQTRGHKASVVLESADRTADSKEKAAEVCFNPGRLFLVSPTTAIANPRDYFPFAACYTADAFAAGHRCRAVKRAMVAMRMACLAGSVFAPPLERRTFQARPGVVAVFPFYASYVPGR